MADQPMTVSPEAGAEDYVQLSQAKVPLNQAADVFAGKDASGRTPVVVLTERQSRIHSGLLITGVIVLIAGLILGFARDNFVLISGSLLIGLAFAALSLVGSFRVTIPVGVSALLMQRGKYLRTVNSGSYVLSPWVVVSHLVTCREIPFEVPVIEAPTNDNVRVNVDTLVTFTITDPYKFVYSLSASDFDRVFQAACQHGMRAMVREIDSIVVSDFPEKDTSHLREQLGIRIEPYGVKIMQVDIVSAQPPADFLASHEARQLALLQQSEQAERQALAQRRQADADALERQRVIAEVERAREALQLKVQELEARKHLVQLEAEAEEERLARLQERLHKYPEAVQYEVEGAQLDIARGLASNTRAVVQLGENNDISRTFLLGTALRNGDKSTATDDLDIVAENK